MEMRFIPENVRVLVGLTIQAAVVRQIESLANNAIGSN